MKKRQFLIPLTVLAASMVSNNASASTEPLSDVQSLAESSVENVISEKASANSIKGNNLNFLVSRSRGNNGKTIAWHSSHGSHGSHTSHNSGY